jgi:hypothetical protein
MYLIVHLDGAGEHRMLRCNKALMVVVIAIGARGADKAKNAYLGIAGRSSPCRPLALAGRCRGQIARMLAPRQKIAYNAGVLGQDCQGMDSGVPGKNHIAWRGEATAPW